MFFWLLLMIGMVLGAVAGLIYLVTRFRHFLVTEKTEEYWKTHRKRSYLLATVPVLFLLLYCVLDTVNGIVVTLNLVVIWLIADLIAWIVKKIRKKPVKFYWAGICAIVFTVAYLGSGWYFAHHVYETTYKLKTEKNLGMDKLRIAQVSDSHVGATFYGEGFAKYMEQMQHTNPDVIIVTGDFVDDGTTKEDMIICCEALGKLQSTYGCYYICGNHDKGYYNYRNFSYDELTEELKKNNVRVLEDEVVELNENVVLIGRQDRTMATRADMETLIKDIDKSKYMIVLDHQPNDYTAQAKSQVDLVLSGHTHGGQMFPIGIVGELIGANDSTYGLERRDKTDFIVNSGISDWEFKYKTGGAISEYGIIDVMN